mmetsp:Transcript_12999/g.15259  ORF Transcript_12999/g.15259 Transcript_12999/m.15259 type:complete len:96 (+) Transcript_12999:287-574(+)
MKALLRDEDLTSATSQIKLSTSMWLVSDDYHRPMALTKLCPDRIEPELYRAYSICQSSILYPIIGLPSFSSAFLLIVHYRRKHTAYRQTPLRFPS